MAKGNRVSVVIATYNRPQSLSACLESLEEQTIAPYEVVVVVDGGPVDESQEVIRAFKGHNRLNILEVINRENRGAPISKNRGAEATSGDIVAFVDDDITLAPDWIAQILRGYEENENAVAVGGRCIMSRWLFRGRFYRFSLAVRERLLRGKVGKLSFIGMPYMAHVFPSDGCVAADFLHGGNLTVLREPFLSTRLDASMGVRDEFDLCVRLRKNTGGKLIYSPRAVAHHNVVVGGGLSAWGHERLCLDIRDHVPYLMKNYDLKYLRLAVFCALVSGYSLLTLRPMYLKALWNGLKRYGSWHQSQQIIASAEGDRGSS